MFKTVDWPRRYRLTAYIRCNLFFLFVACCKLLLYLHWPRSCTALIQLVAMCLISFVHLIGGIPRFLNVSNLGHHSKIRLVHLSSVTVPSTVGIRSYNVMYSKDHLMILYVTSSLAVTVLKKHSWSWRRTGKIIQWDSSALIVLWKCENSHRYITKNIPIRLSTHLSISSSHEIRNHGLGMVLKQLIYIPWTAHHIKLPFYKKSK